MNCPHCGHTARYTDPQLQVRCTGCLNPINDQAPSTPIGRMIDTEAPIIITRTLG
jgi:hypothetical protein